MKHIRKFNHEGSPDELYQFLHSLLVKQEFGEVSVPSIELFGSGDIVGAVYDDIMETVSLVSAESDSLLDDED